MIIHQISFKNFYSFKEKQVINFEVNNKAPKTEAYFQSIPKTRLSKILAIFGPNASGKTNLLKTLHFLKWFILHSFDNKPTEEISFKPFIFDSSIKKNSIVSIDFEIGKELLSYTLEFNQKQVISENLTTQQKNKNKKTLFNRSWNAKTKNFKYDLKNFGLPNDFKKFIKNNTSIISAAIQVDHPLSNKIRDSFQDIKGNVVEHGRMDNKNDNIGTLFEAAEFFNKNKILKSQAEELLKKYDLGLSEIDIKESEINLVLNKNKKDSIFIPYGIHKNGKLKKSLAFFYESGGTKNLFILLKDILPVLQKGGVLALDEFDADLHPYMIPELLQLFTSNITNPNNAQLLFSTHHPEILTRLDKYQILLVEKNDDLTSEVWRLDEMKGIRPDENYYSKYISGAYGAVPNFK